MRVDGCERAEFAIEEARDEFPEEAVVLRETDLGEGDAAFTQGAREAIELRAFPGTVDPLDYDQLSADRH